MRLVAIDPGRHTGFAFFDDERVEISGMFLDDYPNVKHFLEIVEDYKPDEIVIESFRLAPQKATAQFWNEMLTPQLIGIFRFWAWDNNFPVILQPPSVKQAFPDARLKKIGLYVDVIHTRDAIRHGLYRLHFGRKKEGKA